MGGACELQSGFTSRDTFLATAVISFNKKNGEFGQWVKDVQHPGCRRTHLAGSRQRFSQLQQFAIRLNIAVRSR